jgi:hypothetical protein
MASFMLSVGRSFSIEPASAYEDGDGWDSHPALSLPGVRQAGRELVDTMARWFDSGRRHRLDALGAQVERAMRIGGQEALSAVADSPHFTEWAEGASKVDPRDRALADVWQAALISLQKGGVDRLRMLTLAQAMKPDEASAFRALAARSAAPRPRLRRRLQALGLVRTPVQRLINRNSVFLLMSLVSAACFVDTVLLTSPQLLPRLAEGLALLPAQAKIGGILAHPTAGLILVIGCLLTAMPMLVHLVLDEPQLTEDGVELRSLLEVVREETVRSAQIDVVSEAVAAGVAAAASERDAAEETGANNVLRFRDAVPAD